MSERLKELSETQQLEHDIRRTLQRTKCIKSTAKKFRVGEWRVKQEARTAMPHLLDNDERRLKEGWD